jgi:outer membrane protein
VRQALKGLLLAASLLTPALAHAEAVKGSCADGVCRVSLTPDQLLAKASELVAQHDYTQAQPMIAALSTLPGYTVETHFLSGFIAVENGDTKTAIQHFRAALAADPKATRIRLELARALMLEGKRGAADYNFRLAAQDSNLPPEIAATIRASRGLLRDAREWHLSTQFGLAPDTNITNGTNAQTVDLVYGNQTIPLTLDANARARSGIGQTGSLSAGWRGRLGESLSLLVDLDGQGTNYSGSEADDFTGQFAIGPELKLSDTTQVSAQAIGSQRWFGGQRASTQFGTRISLQSEIGSSQRVGLTLDGRHTTSALNGDYSGWNFGAYASYERVMMRTMVASATVFGRVDTLASKAYSSRELGVNLGIGGELRHGINAGLSGGISRALYDAPLLAFSPEPRKDWRLNARAYVGLRSIRVWGFSPSVTYSWSRNGASLPLYVSERSRFAFELARYF